MRKATFFRSALAMVLCLAMVLSFVPPVKAASTDNFSTSAFEGLKLSILGDSISTFEGVSNSTSYNATLGDNIVYYWKSDAQSTGVELQSETWWQQTIDALGMSLCVNNSYSGSCMASAFNGDPAAYVDRCVQLHNTSNVNPDVIAFYMGTNDCKNLTSTSTMGTVDAAKKMTASSTPSTILEAYSVMLQKSMAKYTKAEFYCFTLLPQQNEEFNANKEAYAAFNNGVAAIAEHFGAYVVDLYNNSGVHTDKLSRQYFLANDLHPNEAGMDAITNCFISALLENSKYMTEDTCKVSYELTNAYVKTGSVSGTALAGDVTTVVSGKPFEIELGTDGGNGLDITVTMGGEDITAQAVSGSTVSIEAVTGDITVTATELDSFYWQAESTGLHSGTAFDADYTYNYLTKLSGTYSGATFDSTGVQYQLGESINLLHDRPWVLEFEAAGEWSNGSLLLSYDSASNVSTNTYLFRTASSGLLVLGIRNSSVYEHYGVSLSSDVKITASDTHVYRLENRLNSDGTNTVYLSVDGGTAHPMVQHYDATTDTGTTATELSGRDLTFRYMGTSNHPLRNGTLNWVKVYENGEPAAATANRYRWEGNGTGLTSVEDETYTENPATLTAGTVTDGNHTGSIYTLSKPVELRHDRLWSINWRSIGDYAEDPMLFADTNVSQAPYAPFLYCNSKGSCVLGWYDPAVKKYTNYGVDVSGLGLNNTDYYTYSLKNEVSYNADGSYADNMVYLYVDGEEVGPMTTAYPNGTADGTTSTAVAGKDFRFDHFGRDNFTLYSVNLDYIEMNTGCVHSFGEWSDSKAAGCTTAGEQIRSCSLCGEEQTQSIAPAGHAYTAVEYEANCLHCAHTAYTCDVCGDSYKVYSEELYSDWSETKPDVDEALIETKTQYRSSSYETLTSYETSLEGYEQASSQWVKSGSGTVSYVSSWPSGFDTSNSLYTQYNKKASKVTASETETAKTVIDSDAVAGYLYYHWCYSNSYYSLSYKSGSYTTFHAYYDTTNPAVYDCDESDWSYNTGNACCSNSDWFFVAEVYDQNYTNYRKEFTYGRWTDFTDWSDTAITGSDTLKVEERTLYRYVDATVGDHSYSAITTKPTCIATGSTVYTCSICGDSYTEELPISGHDYVGGQCTVCGDTEPAYYLFGYINGANYACEEDYANMGQYKFEDGKLVVTFTQDSYVAVKTEGNGRWYMTQEYVSGDLAVLYNTSTGASEKMFVPGGMEITFTLSYSGDDTLTLSYTSAECIHSYEQTVITAASCETEGKASYTCSKCGDSYEDVLPATGHDFVRGVCHSCGLVDENYVPAVYYLFGYINGNDYGSMDDFENRGEFRFEDGKLVVTFTQDSYIGIKTEDNTAWYMTKEYVTDTTAVFYNTNTGASEKMFVPGCMEVTFTLEETPGDTVTVSYTAVPCEHIYDDTVITEAGCETTGLMQRTCRICLSSVEEEIPAAGHSYEAVVTAPGCITPGYTTHTCSACGDSYTDSSTAATGHDYASEVTTEPGCETTGVMTYTCRICSHSYTGQISASGHNYESLITAPGCTTTGYTTYTCSGCGDSYTADGTAALGHNYRGKTTLIPSCETDGIMTYTCDRCGDSYEQVLEAVGHNYISEATDPTCEADGYTTHTCTVCGASYADTLVPALGHTYVDGVCTTCGKGDPSLAPPSYFLFGYINGANYACEEDYENMGEYEFVDGQLVATFKVDSYIGIKLEDNAAWYMTESYVTDTTGTFRNTNTGVGEKMFVPGGLKITFTLTVNEDDTLTLSYTTAPCDHSYTSQVTTEPTCETAGVKTLTCTLCGDSTTETIDALGHSYKGVVTAPTCTTAGYTTYTCTVCGDSYVGDEVKATGHSLEAVTTLEPTCETDGKVTYTCTVCGHSYTGSIDATGHDYQAVVTAPGCETEGYTTYTCHCGDTYMDDVVDAAGHSYKSETTKVPNCTTDGEMTYTCSVCSHSYTEVLEAIGHNFTSKIIAPTCTENGYTIHTCSLCGYSHSDTVVPAIGHNYESVTTTPATCDEVGIITSTCANCGDSYTEEIAALGHDYDSVTVQPTCTEAGSVTSTCATCGNVDVEEIPAKGHVNKITVITEATCETDGENRLVCGVCGHSSTETVPATGHSFSMGICLNCGAEDPDYEAVNYYLFGYINGANHACEEDYENMGDYLFVGGKLTATFTEQSYVAVKTEGNGIWYMTDGWQENATSVTLYNSADLTTADKLAVPGGIELTFTLAENEDGTLTLSYVAKDCAHNYSTEVTTAPTCTAEGVKTYTCILCGDIYTESIPAAGHSYENGSCTVCGAEDPVLSCEHSYSSEITTAPTCTTAGVKTYTCEKCGDSYTEVLSAEHSYVMGVCKVCGTEDESYVAPNYYLFGYINGANYACEEDYENMGEYLFVDGSLSVTFDTDSYVAVKTEGNGIWYMTDGWQGEDTSFATLYDSSTLTDANKLFVPGGVKITFTLTENAEGTLTLSYTTAVEPSVVPTLTLKYPTVSFEDVIVMNVYYTASNLEDVVEMGLITYSSNVSEWNIENAEEVIPGYTYASDKQMYMSSTNGIAAKNLGDTLYFAVYAKLADGTYTYTKLVSYSPETYAYAQLSTGSADVKPLVVAMLKYGAAAQTFFGHNTAALVDRNLTEEQLALIESYRADMMDTVATPDAAKQGNFVANGGITRKYPTISFEGAFEINYYCVPANTPVDGVTMYYWNQSAYDAAQVLTAENATGAIAMDGTGTYQAAVEGIAAKDLDKGIYVAFVYSDGTTTYSSGVLAYSIGTYCVTNVTNGADVADLAAATAVYGYHAKQTFYKAV